MGRECVRPLSAGHIGAIDLLRVNGRRALHRTGIELDILIAVVDGGAVRILDVDQRVAGGSVLQHAIVRIGIIELGVVPVFPCPAIGAHHFHQLFVERIQEAGNRLVSIFEALAIGRDSSELDVRARFRLVLVTHYWRRCALLAAVHLMDVADTH